MECTCILFTYENGVLKLKQLDILRNNYTNKHANVLQSLTLVNANVMNKTSVIL